MADKSTEFTIGILKSLVAKAENGEIESIAGVYVDGDGNIGQFDSGAASGKPGLYTTVGALQSLSKVLLDKYDGVEGDGN